MQYFATNAQIRKANRTAGLDRYGKPIVVVLSVATHKRVRLEKKTTRARSPDGDTVTIDGTLMMTKNPGLQEGDKLELMDGSKWTVYNVDETLDVQGQVIFIQFGVTKQRTV